MINYPSIVRARLALPDSVTIVCGMALGHADLSEPTAVLETEREDLPGFVTVWDSPAG